MDYDIPSIIQGYAQGYFLMANDDNRTVGWYSSRSRAIVPLDHHFRYPKSLRRSLNQNRFEVAINRDFRAVIAGCADRDSTWICDELKEIYLALHATGWAHSFETWQAIASRVVSSASASAVLLLVSRCFIAFPRVQRSRWLNWSSISAPNTLRCLMPSSKITISPGLARTRSTIRNTINASMRLSHCHDHLSRLRGKRSHHRLIAIVHSCRSRGQSRCNSSLGQI